MSRTRRRDPIDTAPKRPDYVYVGYVSPSAPTEKEVRRAHMDKKKRSKPGRRAKVCLSKGAKAKERRQLDAVVREPEGAALPVVKKTHVWDWN